MGQSVPSGGLLIKPNYEEWLTNQGVLLPDSQDLNKLEEWVDSNLMQFNKGKYKVLHLGKNNPRHQLPWADWQKSSFPERTPG